jgi:hypothetical protein
MKSSRLHGWYGSAFWSAIIYKITDRLCLVVHDIIKGKLFWDSILVVLGPLDEFLAVFLIEWTSRAVDIVGPLVK